MSTERLQRIAKLIEERNLPMKTVSLRAGKNETFVRDMLKRGRAPSAENLDAVEAAIAEILGEDVQKSRKDHDRIPNLLITAGMGNGGLEHIETDLHGYPLAGYTDGGWALPSGVKSRIGALNGIYALPVVGDSMHPTLSGGSIVFVNTRLVSPSPPGIFAVDYGDGLLVKRVELIGGTSMISVQSDNAHYRTYEFARDDVRVWGRVIAHWGWLD